MEYPHPQQRWLSFIALSGLRSLEGLGVPLGSFLRQVWAKAFRPEVTYGSKRRVRRGPSRCAGAIRHSPLTLNMKEGAWGLPMHIQPPHTPHTALIPTCSYILPYTQTTVPQTLHIPHTHHKPTVSPTKPHPIHTLFKHAAPNTLTPIFSLTNPRTFPHPPK